MRASISLLAVLGMVATGLCIPGVTQATEEIVLEFRSLQVGTDVPEEVCERGFDFLDVGNRVPPYAVRLTLDAELWASQTRAKDGKVVNPEVRKVGTGSACAWMDPVAAFGPIDPKKPWPKGLFYGEFQVGDLFCVPVGGEVALTSNTIPVYGIGLGVGSCIIPPDEEQGILGGVASTSSVYNLLQIPGFNTGSFWTVRIYKDTE